MVSSETGDALRDSLQLSDAQRREVVGDLQDFVRARSKVPDTDERLWGLLRLIPLLSKQITLHLDDRGLTVAPVEGRLSAVALLMSRGSSWLVGGEWESVVLACVVRKN